VFPGLNAQGNVVERRALSAHDCYVLQRQQRGPGSFTRNVVRNLQFGERTLILSEQWLRAVRDAGNQFRRNK
jgi:hypothetical protein